jgi:hypothetical protein
VRTHASKDLTHAKYSNHATDSNGEQQQLDEQGDFFGKFVCAELPCLVMLSASRISDAISERLQKKKRDYKGVLLLHEQNKKYQILEVKSRSTPYYN